MKVIVIKSGNELAHTAASVKFTYYGEDKKENKIIVCTEWKKGFRHAKEFGAKHALFINSGTVFFDLQKFLPQLDSYPNKGLIGHLVDPGKDDQYYYLDEQCFYLDLLLFEESDFDIIDHTSVVPKRSKTNIHHDYTPLTLHKTSTYKNYKGLRFGEKLIAKILDQNGLAVNWNDKIRKEKLYLYDEQQKSLWLEYNKEYMLLAERQLWIFNNETYPRGNWHQNLLSPASGLYWILSITAPTTQHIELVDISKVQIQFAKHLWENWNGDDYGSFVYDFIKENKIQHFNLGETETRSKIIQIRLLKKDYFTTYVNEKFDEELMCLGVTNFKEDWVRAKKLKTVNFTVDNLIKWFNLRKFDGYTWLSNIDMYKYTLLTTTKQDIDDFEKEIAGKNYIKMQYKHF